MQLQQVVGGAVQCPLHPDPGLPSATWSLNLFTPGIEPPKDAVPLLIDLAYL